MNEKDLEMKAEAWCDKNADFLSRYRIQNEVGKMIFKSAYAQVSQDQFQDAWFIEAVQALEEQVGQVEAENTELLGKLEILDKLNSALKLQINIWQERFDDLIKAMGGGK